MDLQKRGHGTQQSVFVLLQLPSPVEAGTTGTTGTTGGSPGRQQIKTPPGDGEHKGAMDTKQELQNTHSLNKHALV